MVRDIFKIRSTILIKYIMNMKKVYFVRHGQSKHNLKKCYSGSIDSPLTTLGIQQAIETGKLLKNKNITYILSSSLIRAYDTALNIKSVIDSNDTIQLQSTLLLQEVFLVIFKGNHILNIQDLFMQFKIIQENQQKHYILEVLKLLN